MAQRPWPRPCGCQVPRTAEPPLAATQRQRDRPEWEGGTAISPQTSPLFPAPGGIPSGHLLPDTEAAQGGGSSSPHPIFPSHVRWEGKGSNSQVWWPVLLLEAGQKGRGQRAGAPTELGGLAVPYFGERETGATASERSPPRGEGEAQQNPAPPKCIRWRKSISSGEQIECIKLAWNQRSVQMYLNRLSQMECASFEGRLLLLSSLP